VTIDRIEPGLSLRDRVEQSLSAAIISGEMPPGELYSAPTLASRFNVSPTPVREAMLNLEKRGFVEAVRNKGFRVTTVNDRDLREIVAVRQMLEAPPMHDVAAHFPVDRMEYFRGLADDIRRGVEEGDLGTYLAADHTFHLALLEITGNRSLVALVADLRSRTRLTGLASMLGSTTLGESAAEHHELLDLLAAGDGEGAARLMTRHIGHIAGWWAGRGEESDEASEQPKG